MVNRQLPVIDYCFENSSLNEFTYSNFFNPALICNFHLKFHQLIKVKEFIVFAFVDMPVHNVYQSQQGRRLLDYQINSRIILSYKRYTFPRIKKPLICLLIVFSLFLTLYAIILWVFISLKSVKFFQSTTEMRYQISLIFSLLFKFSHQGLFLFLKCHRGTAIQDTLDVIEVYFSWPFQFIPSTFIVQFPDFKGCQIFVYLYNHFLLLPV